VFKAVFFDWFNTLARYEPSREQIQSQLLSEIGLARTPEELAPAILAADTFFYRQTASRPIRLRNKEEIAALYIEYQQVVFREAGITLPPSLTPMDYLKRSQAAAAKTRFVLFDDAVPALDSITALGSKIGLLTNMDQNINPILAQLGIADKLSFVVTSAEAGADKPHPEIFQAALKKAGVSSSEACHVGDQYQNDVLGARGAGIQGVLLDRTDAHKDVTDCPRITGLSRLDVVLKSMGH
jgi:FMN phosphatase YigB (HAD superfamily)